MSAQPEAELTGNVMFYKQPEPLSLERHRTLGAKRVDKPFQFLGASHVVPITVNEFGVADFRRRKEDAPCGDGYSRR